MRHFDEATSLEFRTNPSHISRVVVEVDGQIYDDTWHGGDLIRMEANNSSIRFDRLSEARSTGRFSFLAFSEEARQVLDPIATATITAFSGIMVEGQPHWEQLGKFRINDAQSTRQSDRTSDVSCSLVDQSEVARESGWSSPFQTGGGTYAAAIVEVLEDRGLTAPEFPKLILYTYTDEDCPEVTFLESDDPWSEASKLARSSRSELYFNKAGMIVIEEVPDPENQVPVYTLGGDEFLTEEGRRRISVSRRDVYNGVVCKAEAPWLLFPVSGEYWDDDPASETWRGRMGEKPYLIGSATATSDTQCAAIAKTEYDRVAGVSEEATFNILKDPVVSVGDMFAVEGYTPETRFYTLDGLTYPMGDGSMQGTLRRKRIGSGI